MRWNTIANTYLVAQSEDEHFLVNLSDESFETYELDPPPYTIEVSKKELKQMYYDMVSIRYERHDTLARRIDAHITSIHPLASLHPRIETN